MARRSSAHEPAAVEEVTVDNETQSLIDYFHEEERKCRSDYVPDPVEEEVVEKPKRAPAKKAAAKKVTVPATPGTDQTDTTSTGSTDDGGDAAGSEGDAKDESEESKDSDEPDLSGF